MIARVTRSFCGAIRVSLVIITGTISHLSVHDLLVPMVFSYTGAYTKARILNHRPDFSKT